MKKIIFTFVCFTAVALFYMNQTDDNIPAEKMADSNVVKSDTDAKLKTEKTQSAVALEPKNPFTEVAAMNLDDRWEEEYGCFDVNQTEGDCSEYTFLTARSLSEAEWMRRQGFPSRTLMEMAKDPSMQVDFDALLAKKSPTAHAVAAILALEEGDNKTASKMALRNGYFADKSQSYPYRLYGEVLLAKGDRVSAISQFQIAALLGDTQSNSIVHGIAAGDAIFASHAMNSAHEALSTMFDVIPKDTRPDPFDGG